MSLTETQIRDIVVQSFDLQVHVGPDVLPRKYTVEQIVEEEEGKIAGLGLKSHSFPTMGHIRDVLVKRRTSLKLVGSVTLNYFIGGFNPSAVYASANMSPDLPLIVWFPTVHAWNHLKHNYSDYEIPPEWVKDPSFKPRLKTELKAIRVCDDINFKLFDKCLSTLQMISKMDCVLGTGHLSAVEAEVLANAALDMGIKVILTHAIQKDIDMPLDMMKRLAQKGALVEFSYVVWLDRDDEEDYLPRDQARMIQEVGAENCILSSDTGQRANPPPSQCIADYIRLLEREGITREQFETMLIRNPRLLLDLDDAG